MTVFEYASGLISIVVGLAVARVLGGISNFIAADRRIGSDWIVASWCFALLINLVSWWLVGWYALSGQAEIDFATLFTWILATSPLYAAAHVLVPDTAGRDPGGASATLQPLRGAFHLCLAAHFALGLAVTVSAPARDVTSPVGWVVVAVMVAVSASGVLARSDRARALHLLAWLAVLAVLAGGFTPAIG
jgi:Zn-dependent protease with chaperone function